MAVEQGKLRSADWFGREDKGGFIHRSWMKRGLPEHEFDGRPVIGICKHVVRADAVQYSLSRLSRSRQARRVRSRRVARRIPSHLAGRAHHASDDYALPQLGEHGRGGVHSRQPG